MPQALLILENADHQEIIGPFLGRDSAIAFERADAYYQELDAKTKKKDKWWSAYDTTGLTSPDPEFVKDLVSEERR